MFPTATQDVALVQDRPLNAPSSSRFSTVVTWAHSVPFHTAEKATASSLLNQPPPTPRQNVVLRQDTLSSPPPVESKGREIWDGVQVWPFHARAFPAPPASAAAR